MSQTSSPTCTTLIAWVRDRTKMMQKFKKNFRHEFQSELKNRFKLSLIFADNFIFSNEKWKGIGTCFPKY